MWAVRLTPGGWTGMEILVGECKLKNRARKPFAGDRAVAGVMQQPQLRVYLVHCPAPPCGHLLLQRNSRNETEKRKQFRHQGRNSPQKTAANTSPDLVLTCILANKRETYLSENHQMARADTERNYLAHFLPLQNGAWLVVKDENTFVVSTLLSEKSLLLTNCAVRPVHRGPLILQ